MNKENLAILVAKAQQGDQNALNDLFNETYSEIYYHALKTVKNQDIAADVTQDTFAEIIKSIGSLKEPSAYMGWAKKIAYSKACRYFKKNRDVLLDQDGDEDEEFDIFSNIRDERAEMIPHESLDNDEFKKTVLSLLSNLPEEQYSAMQYFYYDEMSVSEIAEIQGVSENTVKSRLNYGRKRLAGIVEDYEKKHGTKLRSLALIPFFKWLFADTFSAPAPLGLAESISALTAGTTAATAATATAEAAATAAAESTVGATITTATAEAATAGATTATTVAAKTGMSIGAKIAAAVVAGAVATGGVAVGVVKIVDMVEDSGRRGGGGGGSGRSSSSKYGGRNPETVAEDYHRAIMVDFDADDACSLFVFLDEDVVEKYITNQEALAEIEAFKANGKNELETKLKQVKSSYKSYNIDVKMGESEILSQYSLEENPSEFNESLMLAFSDIDWRYDEIKAAVEEIATVKVTVLCSIKDYGIKDRPISKTTYVCKIEGRWYILGFGNAESVM